MTLKAERAVKKRDEIEEIMFEDDAPKQETPKDRTDEKKDTPNDGDIADEIIE